MALTEEQSLRQAIAREEANLATLEQKRQKSRGQLAAVKAELTALISPISIPSTSATQPSAGISTAILILICIYFQFVIYHITTTPITYPINLLAILLNESQHEPPKTTICTCPAMAAKSLRYCYPTPATSLCGKPTAATEANPAVSLSNKLQPVP